MEDASTTLNGPSSATLTVTLSHTTFPTSLSGSLGAAGTATFSAGGTLPLTNTTTTGAYTGSYSVTVSYN